MQQPVGQTWNGGNRFQMGGPGTTGPPLATDLFPSNIWWSTVSKTFLRSRNRAHVNSFLEFCSRIWSWSFSSARNVESPWRKPNCCGQRMLFRAKNDSKLVETSFSNTGWHKKTVITKNRITSKILFRLTQNFSYISSSLCSRHLQSFKSVLQKLFVSLALKKCGPNELFGAAGTFGSGGQSSRWHSRIPIVWGLLPYTLILRYPHT